MDNITKERIKLLHPVVRNEVQEAVTHINTNLLGKNVRLRLAYTLRTIEEQNLLYAQGRTKPGKIVTNAKGGQSVHNYGLAFDIVILLDKNGDGNFETASWDTKADNDNNGLTDWTIIARYLKSTGWSWGGDWKSFPDYPHFEKTFGHNWRSLQALYNSGNVITETINNKIYKWVKL
jgi:peptidoglycan L-alanyl-D-glutamate endopeptidase CwlK